MMPINSASELNYGYSFTVFEKTPKEISVQKLSKKFDVSEQAITILINNLGPIDYHAFSSKVFYNS